MELEAKCEKYSQIKLDIEKIGRCDVEIITMHDPGGKYSRGLFGETGDFSFTSGMDIEVDPHPPVRHEHDFHLRGGHYYLAGRQFRPAQLAGGAAFYWSAGRHSGHVAESLCIAAGNVV